MHPTLQEVPEECIREILKRLDNHRDIQVLFIPINLCVCVHVSVYMCNLDNTIIFLRFCLKNSCFNGHYFFLLFFSLQGRHTV